MDEEPQDFIAQGNTVFRGLCRSLRHADHDIPERVARPRETRLRQGKREDICRPVDLPVETVQLPHRGVTDKHDAQFRPLQTERLECPV